MMTAAEMAQVVEQELHDLSQPLTSLMCQLELGQMMGDTESLRAAVEAALPECRRLFEGFAAMRNRVVAQGAEPGATA